jgi:Mg-chelatase subunit ChlD
MSNTDNLELNKGDNFFIAPDISFSMGEKDCPGDSSRMEYCKEKTIAFAREASQYDPDGITVLPFGAKVHLYDKVTANNASDIIAKLSPSEGATNTHLAIEKAWELHKAGSYKQSCLMIITDGAPTNRDAVTASIVKIATAIKDNEHEFGIIFLTVGVVNEDLRAFLTMLDDGIPGAPIDIVDVQKLEDVDFTEAFSGAFHG